MSYHPADRFIPLIFSSTLQFPLDLEEMEIRYFGITLVSPVHWVWEFPRKMQDV